MGGKLKKIFLFFLLASLIFLVGCSCESQTKETPSIKVKETIKRPSTPQTHTILIQDNKFIPNTIKIFTGDKVIWINKGSNKHTVTFEDVRINQVLNPQAQVSHVFKEKEEVRYFCSFHPGMQGSIIIN